jgi:hypothetical protein
MYRRDPADHDWTALKELAEKAADNPSNTAFTEAAKPEVVLELIAEIERWRKRAFYYW